MIEFKSIDHALLSDWFKMRQAAMSSRLFVIDFGLLMA